MPVNFEANFQIPKAQFVESSLSRQAGDIFPNGELGEPDTASAEPVAQPAQDPQLPDKTQTVITDTTLSPEAETNLADLTVRVETAHRREQPFGEHRITAADEETNPEPTSEQPRERVKFTLNPERVAALPEDTDWPELLRRLNSNPDETPPT